jgi:hypothetical protein
MKSKSGLIAVTEAAQNALKQIHLIQHHFGGLQDPHKKGGEQGPYFDPLDSLIYIIEAHRSARTMEATWTEAVRWEFAGLSSPRGIRVGVGTFASAHEVAAEAARMVANNTTFLLIDDGFFAKLDATFKWAAGHRSIPEELQDEYATYWKEDGHAGLFRDLLWDILSSLRPVRVPHLRGTLDCEHAIARRGRGLDYASPGFPRTHLTTGKKPEAILPFTEETSWSPSSRPNVVRFVRAAQELRDIRSSREPLSLTGIYRRANLTGASQTRARVAAQRLQLVSPKWKVTALGSRLLAEEPQPKHS